MSIPARTLLTLALLSGSAAAAQQHAPYQPLVEARQSAAPITPPTRPQAPLSPATTPGGLPNAFPVQIPPAAHCALGEPALVQTSVGGTDRGLQLTYVAAENALWLPATTLTASERAYVDATQDCAGETYVRLRPEVTRTLDPQALTLSIDANFALLPSVTVKVPSAAVRTSEGEPLFQLQYDVGGAYSVASGAASQQARLNVHYFQGPVHVQAGAAEVFSASGFTHSYSAQADLTLSPGASVGAFWRSGASTIGSTTLLGGFSSALSTQADLASFGVQGALRSSLQPTLAPLTLLIPSDRDVDVLLDGVVALHFPAAAGTVTVKGLVAPALRGTVEVRSGGLTMLRRAYALDSVTPAGTFSLAGRAGWAPQVGVLLDVDGSVLLTPGMTLTGHVDVLGRSGHASASATWVGDKSDVTASVSAAWKEGRPLQQVYSLRAGTVFGLVRTSAYGVLTPGTPGTSVLGLQATRNFGKAAQFSAGVTYHFDGAWSLNAATQWQPTPQTAVFASAQTTLGGGMRFGVTMRFAPDDLSTVTAQMHSVESQWSADVEYAREIGPDRVRVTLSAPLAARIDYDFNRSISGTVGASSDGSLSGHAGGNVLWVGGKVSVRGSATIGTALLVHTGVPGMPVSVSGAPMGVTDAQGDLLLTGLPAHSSVTVSVDPDSLPIEFSVREPSFSLTLDTPGVSAYDWQDNFIRSHWVTLRWSDAEVAANAVLELSGGLQFYADGDGRVLIPDRADAGTLKSGNEARRCSVKVQPASEVVTCAK